MNSTNKNIIRKRPGPLSKTKNKEFEKTNTISNENSNDQIELVFLDNDKIKKTDEHGTIVVSADSFNNFEKRKSLTTTESMSTTETVKPELKFIRTYAKIKQFPKFITNESQNTENKNSETTPTNEESINGQTKQKNESRNNLLPENYTELSIEPINKIKNAHSASKKIEEIVIKGEIHESIDNANKVGEPPSSVEAANETSSVVNKTPSPVDTKKNRVFIIKNLAGKKVTLIPKSTPVVINNSAVTSAINSSIENKAESTSVLKKPITTSAETKTIKIITPKNAKLIQPHVMKISDVNKSQKYFTDSSYCNLKIQKTESLSSKQFLPQKIIEQIDLTNKHDNRGMKNNVQSNTMPGFSKILQVLTGSPTQTSRTAKTTSVDDTKIPIYVDCQTQTDSVTILKDKAVQTENFMPSPTSSVEDLPNITNLLEYVFSTPKYSTGLDEVKKSDLIDMSKNIVMKGKIMSQVPKGEDGLKKQLFMDLKDCATFDFLGNKPIHNAVIENNLKFLKRQIFALRLRKISVDIENNQGQTALQLAVLHNCNMDIITNLILNGASVNILDNEGNTLLHLAVINSTHFVLELIIKHLIDPVKEINRKNDEGLTALMIASIDSKPEMVDMLLRNKADPNLRDEKSGRTALFHAVELNCNFVINLLLKYRADPKVRNYFGLTALDAAKDLDIADSKILETERESNSLSNHTSVIVNMSANKTNETSSTAGNKRGRPIAKQNDDNKKSKLSFVSSYQKVQISNVKTRPENSGTSSGAGRRKRK